MGNHAAAGWVGESYKDLARGICEPQFTVFDIEGRQVAREWLWAFGTERRNPMHRTSLNPALR